MTSPITFTGPVTITLTVDVPGLAAAITEPILEALSSLAADQGVIMTALEDLQAVDAELAQTVTDMTVAVNRIDTDFAALEAAVASGNDAAIAAETANVRAAVDALKTLKDNIDVTDPAVPVEPPPVP